MAHSETPHFRRYPISRTKKHDNMLTVQDRPICQLHVFMKSKTPFQNQQSYIIYRVAYLKRNSLWRHFDYLESVRSILVTTVIYIKTSITNQNVLYDAPIVWISFVAGGACSKNSGPLTLNDLNGTITTPNYPGYYPNNAKCQWIIVATTNKVRNRFKLKFTCTFTLFHIGLP